MTARNTLLVLYEEWRRQTECEGEAIRARDWPRVDQCQQAKLQLQPLIQNWTSAARREEEERSGQSDALQKELRGLLQQLAQAEVRNQKWLAQQRSDLQAGRAELHQNVRNLRRVRQSYVPVHRSVWQSYS